LIWTQLSIQLLGEAAGNGSLFLQNLSAAFSQGYFGIGGNDPDAIVRYQSVRTNWQEVDGTRKLYDLLKGLVFDDEVMDWVTEALHQSHADEKRFRDQAIAQLQAENGKIQNRLDKLYQDRLDGFIEPAFFERKAQEWKQAQKRLTDQIAEHQALKS
jgi:hypothetical protein